MKCLFFLPFLIVGALLAAQPLCTITDTLYNELDAQATQIMLNEMVAGEIHLPETIDRYSYELFDAVGRRVKISATEQSGSISGLHGIVSGWYVLKVRDHTGKIHLARVIK